MRWHPTPVLLPGKSHGWRSLVGCSPWGREESDTTERLPFHFSLSCIGEGKDNPLQCSCLENPRDGGAWCAAVYGVAQSQTRLKRFSRTLGYTCLFQFWFPQCVCPAVGLLGHRSDQIRSVAQSCPTLCWLDVLAVQGTLRSLLQHHSSKTSILWHSAFFMVQLSHPYMTTGKAIALTRWTFVGKVKSLLFNMLSKFA